ncbi:MAG: hypothetical protein CW742_08125 [Methanoregula sp.]|nr:MAG: hypothetical protein CW742_08125 [Methanoregula sp.]
MRFRERILPHGRWEQDAGISRETLHIPVLFDDQKPVHPFALSRPVSKASQWKYRHQLTYRHVIGPKKEHRDMGCETGIFGQPKVPEQESAEP